MILHRRFHGLLAVLGFTVVSGMLQAAPLRPVQSFVAVACLTALDTDYTVIEQPGLHSLRCEDSRPSDTPTAFATASAITGDYPPPYAESQAAVTWKPKPGPGWDGRNPGAARADVTYEFQFRSVRTLLFIPDFIPVEVTFVLDVDLIHLPSTGGPFAQADVTLRERESRDLLAWRRIGGSHRGSFRQHSESADFLALYWDVPYEVRARSGCWVEVPGGPDVTNSCRTFADPTIKFDQARFNELYGDQAFQLDEYFALELSPGLNDPSAVPEPSTWLLFSAGVVGLLSYRSSKQNS